MFAPENLSTSRATCGLCSEWAKRICEICGLFLTHLIGWTVSGVCRFRHVAGMKWRGNKFPIENGDTPSEDDCCHQLTLLSFAASNSCSSIILLDTNAMSVITPLTNSVRSGLHEDYCWPRRVLYPTFESILWHFGAKTGDCGRAGCVRFKGWIKWRRCIETETRNTNHFMCLRQLGPATGRVTRIHWVETD